MTAHLPPALPRLLHRLRIPAGLLVLLLQKTPLLRLSSSTGYTLNAPAGAMLKSALATASVLGPLASIAGATSFDVSPPSPIVGQVGQPLQAAWTITGTPTAPGSFTITGVLPPGLTIPGLSGNTVQASFVTVSGTPTQAGTYTILVQGFNPEGITNGVQYDVTFEIQGGPVTTEPIFSSPPQNQTGAVGGSVTLTATATGAASYQWSHNGMAVAGATGSSFTISNLQPQHAGLYTVAATNSFGTTVSAPAVVGVTTTAKVAGAGTQVGFDIVHPNGNIFDQVLLTGTAATVTADPGQITRISFIDLTDDIIQLEIGGAGSLTVLLEGSSGPNPPVKYNQPSVGYMKGRALLILAGADASTNVTVTSVGKLTAFDPTGAWDLSKPVGPTNDPANNGSPLFKAGESYDGVADVALLAIASGSFGGIRAAGAEFSRDTGLTGVYAPGVNLGGPLFVHNVSALGDADPVLLTGPIAFNNGEARITGGDNLQPNNRPIRIDGIQRVVMAAGVNSHNAPFPARQNAGRYERNGQDVTSQVVQNP